MCVYAYVYIGTYMCSRMCVCVCVCVRVCVCVCGYEHTHVLVCAYVPEWIYVVFKHTCNEMIGSSVQGV